MKYLSLFIALLFGAFVQAQAPRGFYLSAGLNNTSFKSDDLLADPAMGFRAGVNFNCGYHETYNYQIEVMYNNSNLELLTVNPDLEQVENSKFSYNTIDVGFFFNYYIIKPDEGKFFLGPQAGINFAFGGTFTAKDQTTDKYYLPYLFNENNLDDTPSVTYAAGIGLTGGYNDFRFDLRYTLGLSNVLANVQTNDVDESNQYQGPSLEGKMSMVTFAVSYRVDKLFGGE